MLNLSLTIPFFFLQGRTGIIRVENVFDALRETNVYTKLFVSEVSTTQ